MTHLDECPQHDDHPAYGGGYPCECTAILEELKELAELALFDMQRDEGWL